MKKSLAILLSVAFSLAPMFAGATVIPTGRAYSGDLTITSGTTTDNSTESNITVLSAAGIASTTVASVSGFAAGQYVMIYQVQGTGAGSYEFQLVRAVSGSSLFFYGTLANTYQASGAEVIKVSEYHNVSISGGTWTAPSWNGSVGGVLVAFLTGSLLQTGGTISSPSGFRGGSGYGQASGHGSGQQGEGQSGVGSDSTGANGIGGGGGCTGASQNGGGAGGGLSSGGSGGGASCGSPATGGGTAGGANLQSGNLLFGGGGGGGDCTTAGPCSSVSGATGGGAILLFSASTTLASGSLTATGGTAGACSGNTYVGGGGGAAGSIRIATILGLNLGSGIVTAGGGGASGGGCSTGGGGGGSGYVATVSASSVSGTASPSINTSSTDYIYNIDNQATAVGLSSSI